MSSCAGIVIILCFNCLSGVTAQGQTVPCINDCLAEALDTVPTKGCAAGTFWQPYPFNSPVDSCQPCPAGSYCPGIPYGNYTDYPINLNRAILCPIGTFRSTTGASSPLECELCDPGRFSGILGSTTCDACVAGTFSITSGSTNTFDCQECPPGHFCPVGTGVPEPCPAGSYARLGGLSNESECLTCTLGHFCQIGSVEPTNCFAGTYGDVEGLRGTGAYPGAFLPTPWIDITPGGLYGTDCTACPAPAFCTSGSILPRQCPAGTFLGTPAAEEEQDCQDCPQGFSCSMPVISGYDQSYVLRTPDGESVAGSLAPEPCTQDETVIHHSFPNVTGCVENCPYLFPRQSYCHVAGDGRVPDRTSAALNVDYFLDMRSPNRPLLLRQAALGNLTEFLDNLTSEEAAESVTMLDYNGRTPLHKAAMEDDVEVLNVLDHYGGASLETLNAARDADGFTAVMQALLLDNGNAVMWLVGKGATVTETDVRLLTARGIDASSVPVGDQPSVRYLGRGSFAWTGPGAANFGGLEKVSPMPIEAPWEFSTTTVVTVTSITSTSTSSTTTTSSTV